MLHAAQHGCEEAAVCLQFIPGVIVHASHAEQPAETSLVTFS